MIVGFPTAAIEISVFNEEEEVNVYETVVWYDKFLSTIGNLKKDYAVTEAILYGPMSYIAGLANQMAAYLEPDNNMLITLMPDDNAMEE